MTPPGAPNKNVTPGLKIDPNASPKTHTTRPHPTVATPPRRDQLPRGATSRHRPLPTWIQTAAVAAGTGWLFQMVTPTLTRWCTHPGDPSVAGCTPPLGRPSG